MSNSHLHENIEAEFQSAITPARGPFLGIERLYGEAFVERLKQSRLLVVGLGGVGSWAVESLCRSAVGNIILVDYDDICISNTNRQLHTLQSTVGKSKAEVLKERCLQINPEVKIEVHQEILSADNLESIIGKNIDFVIDAIDSVKAKCELIAYCKKNNIPIIVSGGSGGKVDPTQIQIADITKAFNDPLLQVVRKNLRRFYHFPRGEKKFGISCVFSPEARIMPQACEIDTEGAAVKQGRSLDCATGFGASSFVTGSFGFFAVSYCLNEMFKDKS